MIFFAVSTSLVTQNTGIKLQLPTAETVSKDKKGLILSVDKNEVIYLDNSIIPFEMIQKTIFDLKKSTPTIQVIINADTKTPYEKVISILDQVRLGGCFDVVLEAKKKKHGLQPKKN